MTFISNPLISDADHLSLVSRVLCALERGRMPMHPADYRDITAWAAQAIGRLDSKTLHDMRRAEVSPLRAIVENVLHERREPWAANVAARQCAEEAWCGLRHRLQSLAPTERS